MAKTIRIAGLFYLVVVLSVQNSLAQDARTPRVPIDGPVEELRTNIVLLEQAVRQGNARIFQELVAEHLRQPETARTLNHDEAAMFSLSPHSVDVAGDSAIADCLVSYGPASDPVEVRLVWRQSERGWKLSSSEEKATARKVSIPLISSSHNLGPASGLENFSAVYSSELAIQRPHPGVNYLLINQSLTMQSPSNGGIGRRLFGYGSALDGEGLMIDTSGYNVGITLDPYWRRIVYGRQHPSDRWLKSYGDNVGDYQFSFPVGMTNDQFDTIHVAEGNGSIVKLWYNRASRTITFVSEFRVPGVYVISDITYLHARPSFPHPAWYCDPTYGRIWIADDLYGRVVVLNRSGQVLGTIEHYTFEGVTYRLRFPRKIVADYLGKYLAIIDAERNALVVVPAAIPGLSNTVTATGVVEFPRPQYLALGLGQTLTREWWVADRSQRSYHTATLLGSYLASYNAPAFGTPVGASRPKIGVFGFSGCVAYGSLMIFTSDEWSHTDGLRGFLPGADALNLSADKLGNLWTFRWRLTNRSHVSVQVLDCRNGLLATVYSASLLAGDYEASFPVTSLPANGSMKLRVSVLPYYNDIYGTYARNWLTRDIEFADAPSTFSYSPSDQIANAVYHGETQSLRVHPHTTDPLVSYDWTYKLRYRDQNEIFWFTPEQCGPLNGATFGASGPIASLSNYSFSPYYCFGRPDSVVRVEVVSAACDRSETRWWMVPLRSGTRPPPPAGSGCPFVYTWDGNEWVIDNNILPQSEDPQAQGVDVTDYYQLFRSPVEVDGRYRLAVAEYEQEHSVFDQFQLLLVDHQRETFITIDDSGTIYQFANPLYFIDAQLDSESVVKRLYELDGIKVEVAEGDSLHLWFESEGGTIEPVLRTVAQHNSAKRPVAAKVHIKSLESGHQPGRSAELNFSTFRLRRYPSYAWVLLPASDTTTLELNIEWTQDAAVDYTEMSKKLELPFIIHSPQLLSASHSTHGEVADLVRYLDGDYTELTPDEWIELHFEAPPLDEGMQRSFIFASHGRYERIGEGKIQRVRSGHQLSTSQSAQTLEGTPLHFHLGQNFPNPFNPITLIRFDVPEPAHVSIVLYDILGRKIQSLFDGRTEPGFHQVVFDASHLASGIYLYRMTAGLFTQVRKFVVMK